MRTEIRRRKKQQPLTPQPQNSFNTIVKGRPKIVSVSHPKEEHSVADRMVKLQAIKIKIEQYVTFIGFLVTLLLVARIGLKMIAVNPGTPLGRLIIDVTDLLLRPFFSLTETLSGTHVALLELSALTAVLVYPLVAWCLVKLLHTFHPSHRQ